MIAHIHEIRTICTIPMGAKTSMFSSKKLLTEAKRSMIVFVMFASGPSTSSTIAVILDDSSPAGPGGGDTVRFGEQRSRRKASYLIYVSQLTMLFMPPVLFQHHTTYRERCVILRLSTSYASPGRNFEERQWKLKIHWSRGIGHTPRSLVLFGTGI
jgi:hypothetical protein